MGNFNPDVEAPGFEMPSWAGPSSKLVNWAIPQQPLPKRTASACGRRERRVFRHQPRKKNTHTRSKIRLVAGVEKNLQICSVQTYIINGHERWCICLCGNDHHEEKLANGHMAPLCGTSGSHSAAGIVSVSSIQWLGDLANEFAMVSSI
jgi:hypothetical protein